MRSTCVALGPQQLLVRLEAIRTEIVREGAEQYAAWSHEIRRDSFRPSALNLAHYLALRRRDLRELQVALMPFGLSSLGRCESRVLPNLDAVIAALARFVGDPDPPPFPSSEAFFAGELLLQRAAEEVFGPTPASRTVRIMVTLPEEAASDLGFTRRLLAAGTDAVRINCAHDDADVWAAMAANVRAASDETNRPCTICIDIAGPKVRIERVFGGSGDDDGPRVQRGDRILLVDESVAADRASPVGFTSSIPGITSHVRVGDPVWIDDGKIGTRVVEVRAGAAVLEVHTAPNGGARLRPEKGLNFPETELGVPVLGTKDRRDLDSIVRLADMVGYSFVSTASDVALLQSELERCCAGRRSLPAIVLKIETVRAVRNLPALIVAAAGRGPVAVMIARGDLAVNIGYHRLAEIQEEILWLCESVRVPVIWATQVLERLVKKGRASRGEFTDAAMAERAECVMLNKGPYVVEAVAALDDVLSRMEGHQAKKTSRLRSLHAWEKEATIR